MKPFAAIAAYAALCAWLIWRFHSETADPRERYRAAEGESDTDGPDWLRAPLTLSRDAHYAPDEAGRYRCAWVPEMGEAVRQSTGRKHAE